MLPCLVVHKHHTTPSLPLPKNPIPKYAKMLFSLIGSHTREKCIDAKMLFTSSPPLNAFQAKMLVLCPSPKPQIPDPSIEIDAKMRLSKIWSHLPRIEIRAKMRLSKYRFHKALAHSQHNKLLYNYLKPSLSVHSIPTYIHIMLIGLLTY